MCIRDSSISDNTVGCEKFSLSVFVKSAPDNDKGYYRTAIHTNDTNGPNSSVGQRYIRNFYTIAPKQFYKWYHTRVDLNEGNELDWEDGIRIFSRIYNDGYESIVDGIHVHAGDTLPMSYQHQDETRAKETFTFPVSVNPNSFKISFYWQAIASFVDIHEDLELMRVNIDSNNYIRLVALAGTRWQRQYRTYDVHGPHDPKFEIQKYVSGTKVASASIVCYWNYDLRGGSIEPQDEVLKFTIEHFADDYLMLRINKYGFEGRKSVAPSASEFSTNSAEIKYNGHGWYSKPTIYNTATLENGRKIPARRKGVLSRIREADRDCCMIGERDPDNGNQIEDTCYSQGEFWKYPDQTVIGANWKSGSDPYYSVGGGWRVESSGVICTGSGIARWDLYPRHQDIIIKGNVSTDTDGNRVGLLGRFDDNLRQTGYSASGVTAYGAELKQTGSSSAEVRIMKWWYGTDTELVKDTLSSYTADENLELIFTLQGSGLTAEIAGRGSCSIGDTQLQKPRRVGIYGIAESSTVTMDDFHVRPNFASGVLE